MFRCSLGNSKSAHKLGTFVTPPIPIPSAPLAIMFDANSKKNVLTFVACQRCEVHQDAAHWHLVMKNGEADMASFFSRREERSYSYVFQMCACLTRLDVKPRDQLVGLCAKRYNTVRSLNSMCNFELVLLYHTCRVVLFPHGCRTLWYGGVKWAMIPAAPTADIFPAAKSIRDRSVGMMGL